MTRLTSRTVLGDIAIAIVFFTRLPLPPFDIPGRKLGDAIWAAPIAGLVVALFGAFAYTLAHAFGMSPNVSAAITLAVLMITTGCLHEDGLADTADAFGGGKTVERKLEIMHDSRLGTYGAAALFMSMLLRWAAIASLPGGATTVCALIAAHVASRGIFAALVQRTPLARDSGLAASVGAISDVTALTGMITAGMSLLFLGVGGALAAGLIGAGLVYAFRTLCIRQIGGLTGDTLGAAQQIVEIAILLIASVTFI